MSAHRIALPLLSHLRPVFAALAHLPSRALAMGAVVRSRRSLARLDDRLLRDIGVTREEALREARRPGWDAPSHWVD